ncbi:MAG: hypothetical protein JSS20_19935, partial [Proteobacteria bacterium]|nr:hypothetical protein [Pseudomonadota bacterium]
MSRLLATRRELLVAGTTLALSPHVRALAADGAAPTAQAASGSPILISIFLRGGMDALSFIAPVDDKDFIADRAPELRLSTDGPKPAIRLDHAPEGHDFRIHPEAAPLLETYQSGRLAFVHAAGIGNGTRSHFGAQEL